MCGGTCGGPPASCIGDCGGPISGMGPRGMGCSGVDGFSSDAFDICVVSDRDNGFLCTHTGPQRHYIWYSTYSFILRILPLMCSLVASIFVLFCVVFSKGETLPILRLPEFVRM